MKYLLQFTASHHETFWLPELDSILEMYGTDPLAAYDHKKAWENVALGSMATPFLIVELESEKLAKFIGERAILTKRVMELWGHGATFEEASEEVRRHPEKLSSPYFSEEVSWSIQVAAAGYTYTMEEQEKLRKLFAHMPFRGPVQCRKPMQLFMLWGDFDCEDGYREGRLPKWVYFGRRISDGNRDLIGRFDLKKRSYLGPTSMDNELSLVMANMVKARPGAICFDPFVGTGSILVACTHFGAFCMGTDIDVRVLKGKDGKNVYTNFEQYGLAQPELIRSDNALYNRHFREVELYDSVVCDPPYGIRAGARKSGRQGGNPRPVAPEDRWDHVPHTQPYPVEDVLVDLLDVSAQTLVMGGRLCYLLASTWDFDIKVDLPRHPCLELRFDSVQGLTQIMCRRLITMVKVRPYSRALRGHYLSVCRGQSSDRSQLPFSSLRARTFEGVDGQVTRRAWEEAGG
ncbi:unnamed protein product, partial [Discosporangium mesarthrocarpum]